jgi:hypothetical protein
MKDLKHIKRFNETQENLNISDVRRSFLLGLGFRQIEESHLYKVDLPTDGTSLVTDIHYNLWMEYWHDGKVEQSVGFGKYSENEFKTLIGVLLR